MLGVIVALLVGYILYSNSRGQPLAKAIPFLPLVIVTGLIERFWTTEEEDGTGVAFRTMLATLVLAIAVFLVVRWEAISRPVIDHPESLGLIVAAELVLGRYTGYRLTELYRFRHLAK
jgi:hypothetical protein